MVRDLWRNRGCSMYCKMRGHRDGACAWDTESGANDCHCDTELRGIRSETTENLFVNNVYFTQTIF